MPRLLFKFQCEKGHSNDLFVDTTIKEVECPDCGEQASRKLTPPHFPLRQGVDPDMPTAADKWNKIHRKLGSGQMTDSNNDNYGGPRPQDVDFKNNPDG